MKIIYIDPVHPAGEVNKEIDPRIKHLEWYAWLMLELEMNDVTSMIQLQLDGTFAISGTRWNTLIKLRAIVIKHIFEFYILCYWALDETHFLFYIFFKYCLSVCPGGIPVHL